MVTGLLLVAAVLTFAGLAYQTVPLTATQTMTRELIETGASYSPYPVTDTLTYTTTSVSVSTLTSTGGEAGCLYDEYGCTPWYVSVSHSSITFINTLQTTYETSTTAVVPYSQTVTSQVTESSTSLVPASTALGLTDGSFTILAATVIGLLTLLTAGLTLKPRMTGRPKQATPSEAPPAATAVPAPQPEPPKTIPSPRGNRITVDRKEFEGFLAENQKFLDRSQALISKVDQLANQNKQLRDELQAAKARLGPLEPNTAQNTRQAGEPLREAREIISRLTKEEEKRTSKEQGAST